jgi:signal transduction histidine kinase
MTRSSLAVLAHEIRSPVAALTAIAGAYRAADRTKRLQLVALAVAAVDSIERLLADPLLISHRTERLDAGVLAAAAAAAAALGGAPVVATVEHDLVVDGDRARLRQALDNLVANALVHGPAGSVVRVDAYAAGGAVVLAVTDEGGGIEAAEVARIFEPGVRLDPERPGSGLGLAVVREVAASHGGTVEVESSPGRGSAFRLVLPGASGGG